MLLRRPLILFCVLALLSACSPSHFLINRVADELASQGQTPEDDLVLAREASAFYLKLSESLLRQTPAHVALGTAVAGGFTQYAYAFVAFEAERVESQNASAALRLRQRAARLYRRAHQHAMAVLEQRHPGLQAALAQATTSLPGLADDEVALAYWAAASWGAHIALSKDQPDVVADLPLAMRLARWAWQHAPGHGEGALAALVATFEATRPGGSRTEAQRLFDQAEQAGAGRNASIYVSRAEALGETDRLTYEHLLLQALRIAAQRQDIAHQLVRERAQWLLDTADDRF